jgi:hypothetical protein
MTDPVPPAFRTDLYRGTAAAYDRFRPRHPTALIADLVARTGADGTGRLLDLACGTGQAAFALAESFADWAVDQRAGGHYAAVAGPAGAEAQIPAGYQADSDAHADIDILTEAGFASAGRYDFSEHSIVDGGRGRRLSRLDISPVDSCARRERRRVRRRLASPAHRQQARWPVPPARRDDLRAGSAIGLTPAGSGR